MKRTFILIIFLYVFSSSNSQQMVISKTPVNSDHPRMFISGNFQEEIETKIEIDSALGYLHGQIIAVADSMLLVSPLIREMNGRRLLSVSRKGLKRCLYLAYAYQTTKDKRYLEKAEKEMLALSSFTDWNPSHFLDVAEMTAGMAIGYDWLYNDLQESTRKIIREAIISKGILPSFDPRYNDWLKVENNWNQVCNTGITMGALSIMEDEPEMAEKVLARAIETIEIPLEEYKPNGVYPEGPMYWGYGTTFNVMFYDLLLSVFNKDFGIIQDEFLQSAYYYMHATAPSGDYFNYSDSNTSRSIGPALYWFANYMDAPGIMKNEFTILEQYRQNPGHNSPNSQNQRLLPFALVWAGTPEDVDAAGSQENVFFGRGEVPVVMYRSAWDDPKAMYLAIKGGSPSANHGHMDVGSFVLEFDGVRWAHDFGTENYTSLESAGLDIWNSKQQSDRWKVYRYNNRSHNTLTIDEKDQNVIGHAEIKNLNGEKMAASLDLTELYEGSIDFAERKFEVIDNDHIKITDSVTNNSKASTIRWTMITKAVPEILNPQTLSLKQDNEEIELKIVSPGSSEWQIFMTNPQPAEYDSENPGVTVLGVENNLDPQESLNLAISILNKE